MENILYCKLFSRQQWFSKPISAQA